MKCSSPVVCEKGESRTEAEFEKKVVISLASDLGYDKSQPLHSELDRNSFMRENLGAVVVKWVRSEERVMKMESTTIEISNLPESVLEALSKRAEEVGATMPEYVRYLIEDDLASSMSLRVLFAPVREQIKESGISEEELDALLEEAREEAFQERQGKGHGK